MKLRIHVDGGSRGNPGPAGAGIIVVDAEADLPILEAGYFLGRRTNNQAEYEGLLRALDLARRLGAREIEILSDSELLVRQLTGQYQVKSPAIRPLHAQALGLLQHFEHWQVQHVPRQLNRQADRLANLAMNAQRDVIEHSAEGFLATLPPAQSAPSRTRSTSRPSSDQPARPTATTWRLRFVDPSGSDCPAAHHAGQESLLGPTTPADLCVHAALTALQIILSSHPRPGLYRCLRCGAQINIEPLSPSASSSR